MELIQASEMSANYNLTPGKYPEENIQAYFYFARRPQAVLDVIEQPDCGFDQTCAASCFLIKPTDALISQIYFVKKLYIFRVVSLPIIRSLPLYIRHWYISCTFDDIYQCRM